MVGSKTYAISSISSVQLYEKGAPCLGPIMMVLGAASAIASLGALFSGKEPLWGLFVVSLFVAGIGYAMDKSTKPEYRVRLKSASGEEDVMQSPDKPTMQRLVDAINEELASRG